MKKNIDLSTAGSKSICICAALSSSLMKEFSLKLIIKMNTSLDIFEVYRILINIITFLIKGVMYNRIIL